MRIPLWLESILWSSTSIWTSGSSDAAPCGSEIRSTVVCAIALRVGTVRKKHRQGMCLRDRGLKLGSALLLYDLLDSKRRLNQIRLWCRRSKSSMWIYSCFNKILTARWALPSDVQRACSEHGLWRLLSIVEKSCTIPGNPPEGLCSLSCISREVFD